MAVGDGDAPLLLTSRRAAFAFFAADGVFSCLANELLRRMAGKSVEELIALVRSSSTQT